MTKDQINDVLERVRTWPEEQQAYAAEVLLAIEAQQGELLRVSDEEWAAIQEGSAQAERGFASDEEMAAVLEPAQSMKVRLYAAGPRRHRFDLLLHRT